MSEAIIAALIGAAATVIAAWLSTRKRHQPAPDPATRPHGGRHSPANADSLDGTVDAAQAMPTDQVFIATSVAAPAPSPAADAVTTNLATDRGDEDRSTAGTDALGRRLNSGAHFVCVALAQAGERGATCAMIEEIATELAKRAGVKPRGAVYEQLICMKKEEGLADDGPSGWRLTPKGRKLWEAGKPTTRKALREGRMAS